MLLVFCTHCRSVSLIHKIHSKETSKFKQMFGLSFPVSGLPCFRFSLFFSSFFEFSFIFHLLSLFFGVPLFFPLSAFLFCLRFFFC